MSEGKVTGWKLADADRQKLLARFAPLFPDRIADHVTLDSEAGPDAPLPEETRADVVGEVDDGAGLEALVVAIGGTTDRPDGSTYHITWSLDRAAGREAVESNEVIARLGWRSIAEPIAIEIIPARF
ncbi:MAG: hypothetical protein H7X93_04050 [Sphingomonadaceae bacterium]|nr:hypothetical protein [Sphingomonadaceae bacterium]